MSDLIKRAFEIVGLGKVGSNSHPIHPSTVHFPIAFLTGSNILNLLYGACLYTPALVPFAVDKENTGTIAILGYFLNLTGIVTSIPAVLTGFAELYAMIQGRGLMVYDKKLDCKVIEPVVKTTLTHATLNDIAVGAAVYNWIMERNHPLQDYRPAGHQVLLSGVALGLTFYAAYLGGGLVYEHGVGVQRMGLGKELKDKEIAEKAAKKE